MGFKMEIEGLSVGKDVELLNGATIHDAEEVDISVKNLDIGGKLSMMNDMEIKSMFSELKEKSLTMDRDSREYKEIQGILGVKHWDKKQFVDCARKHIADFSKGVLASIVANFLMR